MDSFYMFIDIMVVICGVYVVYQYIMMIRTEQIRENMLLPKDINIKKCKDVQGYIKSIGPKQLAFGIAATVCGIVGIIQDMYEIVSISLSLIIMVVFVAVCIWYGVAAKKAVDKFW